MQLERILVIGSNSFSGATFVALALSRGHTVVGVSRSAEPNPVFLPYRWQEPRGTGEFSFRQMDLNERAEEIAQLAQDLGLTHVVNFAAQSMVAESWLTPADWYRTNVLANVRLHERLRRWSGLVRYLHVSTPEVYGNCQGVVDENAPYNPSTPYAASRAACDMHLMTFHRHHGFPVVFTRASNVYGPGQQLYRILPRAMLCARLGRRLPLHGGGHSTRAFTHARDVATATMDVLLRGQAGSVYHVSSDRFVSIRDLVKRVAQRMDVAFEDLVEDVSDRPAKDAAYLLDCGKLRRETGWAPELDLEAGMEDVAAWVDRNLTLLRQLPDQYVHKP